jgi:gamma-glutamyl-gamma-aminobutyrate hydrolase PuuD
MNLFVNGAHLARVRPLLLKSIRANKIGNDGFESWMSDDVIWTNEPTVGICNVQATQASNIASKGTMSEQVRAAHLLIKHTGSRNPVSRRTGAQVDLSPEDAVAELKQFEAKINQEGVDSCFPKCAKVRR